MAMAFEFEMLRRHMMYGQKQVTAKTAPRCQKTGDFKLFLRLFIIALFRGFIDAFRIFSGSDRLGTEKTTVLRRSA